MLRDKHDHEVFLSPDNNVAVFWKLLIAEEDDSNTDNNADTTDSSSALYLSADTTPSKSTLFLAVAAAASGWAGFGISDAGAMPGADIIIYKTAMNLLRLLRNGLCPTHAGYLRQ